MLRTRSPGFERGTVINMEEKLKIREQQTEEFEAEHRDFLEALRQMPVDRKEERWDFFNKYAQREPFIVGLIEAYRPGAYSKIKDRLEKSTAGSLKEDSNMAYWGSREIDSTVFMETIKDAIEMYVGTNKNGEEYGFVACVRVLYKQKAGRTAAENTLGRKGISDQKIPKRNLPNILKLVKAAEKVWQRESGKRISKEEALKLAVEEVSYHCTKKEMELVQALFFSDNIVISMDMPLKSEDGDQGDTLVDQYKDEKDYFEEVNERETEGAILEAFCQEIEDRWEIISSAKGLKEQELIKTFLTQGVLKELKLDENGKPYLREPAGDEKFYHSLKPKGDFLYHRLFLRNYLERAFSEMPEDFYNVYARFLRENFNFSDKILAEVIGKDKTAVSKGKKRYLTLMKAVYDCCMDRLDM